jgi:LPXTG-site transpeptidase (sortase) family protein
VQIDAGTGYNCGLKTDSSLVCWGEDNDGETAVPSPNTDFRLVSAGADHTCARKSDGSAVCWGDNSNNQTTVPVPNSGFNQLSAGASHTCGLKSDGSFICWGYNTDGQVDPNYFVDVSAGGYHTCAIDNAGVTKCWGQNLVGESAVPSPNTNYYQISADWATTCGLKNDGSITCWGIALGSVPTANADWRVVSAGWGYACALKDNNDLYCWPTGLLIASPAGPISEDYRFLSAGYNSTCASNLSHTVECWSGPLVLPSPNINFYNLSTGDSQACGIKGDSTVFCWGDNSSGESTVPAPNASWKQVISVGLDHACSIKDNASENIVCWGDNSYGQSSVPAPNSNFSKVEAGYNHTCGLKNDGTLLCWGRNDDSQSDVPYLTALKVPPGNIYSPIAEDDSYSTLEDTPLSINVASGVLANDHDLDSPTLTAHKDSDPSQGSVTLAADGSFTYDPTGDTCGPDSFSYHAEDGTNSSNSATVNLTVTCLNDPPSFSASNPSAVNEEAALQTINGWASFGSPGPPDEAGQSLQGYIVSNISHPGRFSQAPSVDAAGTLTYQPAPDRNGSTTFDVQAQDNGGTANGGVDTSPAQTFTITVAPINDQPDFSASDPPAVLEDAGLQTIPNWATFDPGPANEAGQNVQAYNISNISTPGLFSQSPAVSTVGTLSYQSALNQNGSSTFDIQVQDDGGTASGGVDIGPVHTFTVQVNPDNDPPTTPGLGVFNIVEDTPGNLMDIWPDFDDPEDTDLQLSFSLESHTNPGLFNLIDIDQDRYLRMAYTPDGFGTSTITVRATDTGGLFVDGDLDLTLRPVNDAPSFTPGGNVNVPMNSGPYSAPWASSISAGPANESGQTLSFMISNNNNGLFIAQPDLSLAGGLSFTPVAGVTGSAQVSVTLSDDGGTADGGVDTSPTETFTISVGPFPIVVQVRAEDGPGIFPGATVIDWIDDISISFDLAMDNPPGSGDPDDVTNPDNYLLVEAGLNGAFNTTSCLVGMAGDDVQITIDWVQYPYLGTNARLFINGGISLGSGNYRLFACGSTSLSAGGVALGGDGTNPGTDYSLDFTVIRPDRLPDTGFPPSVITPLRQEESVAYPDSGLILEIPRLDLSQPITGIPFQENNWNVKFLAGRIGWLEGTAFPTWAGNSVLTGHVVNASGLPGPFADLKTLGYGDRILVKGWEQSYIYEVRSVKTLAPDDISRALGHEDYPWLTLVTCSNYSSWQESYISRVVVKAVQVGIR